MKLYKIIDFNRTEKYQFKKKLKLINLNKEKSEGKSLFSQSLYLSYFLHKNKTKKIPDTTKYLNHSDLIIPKPNKHINNIKESFKISQKSKTKSLALNKININNSSNPVQLFKRSAHNTNRFSLLLNNHENNVHGILYEENLKLKTKINKLKLELFFTKSLNKKKDEEIMELNRYIEEGKFLFNKRDKNYFLKKLNNENIIIKLRNSYENIKSKIREENNINKALSNKLKGINFEDLIKRNVDGIKILKDKYKKLKSKYLKNYKIERKLEKLKWKKNKFLENYQFLIKLKQKINQKFILLENLSNKAYILRDKYHQMKSQKSQILRYNNSIILRNKELLQDKKYMQDYDMKKSEIKSQILSYRMKSKDLYNKIIKDEYSIKSFLDWENNNNISNNDYSGFIPRLEPNPSHNEEKQVILYKSLISESKKRQTNLIQLLNDLIENTSYFSNNLDDNSKIFDDNINNINSDINDIKLEYKSDKIEKDKELRFLLNIMFYIKNIKKERIQNILLSYKIENCYLGNLKHNDGFISELSSDILLTINNRIDINQLKEVLNNLYQTKYKNNKIQFLNKILNDIYILDDINNKEILFFKENENILFHKLKNILLNKINNIKKRIKSFKEKKISYENLKSIFIEEKLYDKNNEEKNKLFQFFIYILKKRENAQNQNNSLNQFNTKDIINFLRDLEKEEIIYHDNFIKALKNLLNDKKMNLGEFVGQKKILKISEFIKILKENGFEINDDNFDLNIFLMKYIKEENSGNINIELLKIDLDKISSF